MNWRQLYIDGIFDKSRIFLQFVFEFLIIASYVFDYSGSVYVYELKKWPVFSANGSSRA